MNHHTLKIKEEYYKAKMRGDKLFEIRFNDREFQRGDIVSYTDCDAFPLEGKFQITYVTGFSQKEGWVVFGEKELTGEDR